MIAVEQAIAMVASAFRPLPAEIVGLEAAFGRVLADDVTARLSQPPADVSAMDGYAVRSSDVQNPPTTLQLAGRSVAGASFSGAVGPGEAVRIFTGAVLPAGTDAVVMQENAEQRTDAVVVRERTKAGRHVRRAGQDFAEGEVLLRRGRRLSARDIGLAAAMNVAWLPVRRKPRVAVLANGDELVMPGDWRKPDQIVTSASFSVAAFLRGFGAEPISLGIAADDERSIAAMLQAARGADLVLTIGGVSVGELDLIAGALGESAFDYGFHQVAMRPGKPLLFGRLGDLPVLGLPGNPVSAAVTLLLFGRSAIRSMLGVEPKCQGGQTARLGRDLAANDARQDYLRATLQCTAESGFVATPFEVQDSSMQRLLAEAGCLVVRPPHAAAAHAGERVDYIPFADDPTPL